MKKYVLMTALLGLAGGQVFAQPAVLESEIDADIDQMYVRQAPQQGAPTAAKIQPSGTVSGQPIYILNQATPTSNAQAQATQVQKQPTTYIEASPLTKSRAEQIREARQQVEAETESKIVEKLEQSRIEDEKRRAQVLFGDKFNSMNGQEQQAVQQPAQAVPVYVAPAQTTVVEPQVDTRDMVRSEIRMALDEEKVQNVDPITQRYFTGIAGIGDYPDVENVRGNYLLGAAFGTKFDNTYAVEGSFTYSNYTVQKMDGYPYYMQNQYGQWIAVPPLVDVEQYGGALAVKYYLLDGMVRPVLGGVAQYSYRKFAWSAQNYGGYTNKGSDDTTSHAIDLGVITGAEFEFTPKFSLGLDFRYMFNMSSRVTSSRDSYFLETASFGTPIEKLQYYNLSLAARVAF